MKFFCSGKNNKMQQYWNIDITVVGWKVAPSELDMLIDKIG